MTRGSPTGRLARVRLWSLVSEHAHPCRKGVARERAVFSGRSAAFRVLGLVEHVPTIANVGFGDYQSCRGRRLVVWESGAGDRKAARGRCGTADSGG